jgi:hypothetical protein
LIALGRCGSPKALDHRAGGIGAGPTVLTAQQSLREKLRAAFGLKERVEQ